MSRPDASRSIAAAIGPLVAVAALVWAWTVEPPPNEPRKQIVLIVIDTLRADRLGLYGHDRATSPELDAWSRQARVYEQALATSPWTLPSFGSIYTGLAPARHGAGLAGEKYLPIVAEVPTVAELLERGGLATAAIVNNPFLSSSFGLARGFAQYDYDPGDNTTHRRADEMVDLAIDWIARHRHESFFLVLHLFDPHMNYDAPPPFRGRFTGETRSGLTLPFDRLEDVREGRWVPDASDRDFISAAYDEEVAFTDRETGRLLDWLDQIELYRDGLVLVTSDHGEELFEHDGFEHGHAMWQQLLHVPLLVRGDRVRPGKESAPVTIADIAPTLLDYAGIPAAASADSTSLWPNLTGAEPLPDRALLAESTLYGVEQKVLLRWPYKLTFVPDQGSDWLVRLDRDPGETVDVKSVQAGVARKLHDELKQRMADVRPADVEPQRLDAETLERLRSLGYVD